VNVTVTGGLWRQRCQPDQVRTAGDDSLTGLEAVGDLQQAALARSAHADRPTLEAFSARLDEYD
jgi:hypothetical protein